MRPRSSSAGATTRMLAVRRHGTDCETRIAHEFRRLHVPFSSNGRVLENSQVRPDFVFPDARVAIFIDGCFWHGCPWHGTIPRANRLWWKRKFAQNQQRDARATRRLRVNGWTVRRFWAHEEPNKIAATVLRILKLRARREDAARRTAVASIPRPSANKSS